MESIDYWDDSQFDSFGAFDDSMNTVVNNSIGIGKMTEDATVETSGEGMDLMVLDIYDVEKIIPSIDVVLPCLGRRMTVTLKADAHVVAAVTNDSNLTEPCGEEKQLATATMGARDFDLNKLPIRGMYKFDDPKREESFIEMLRLLLPDFY